MTHIVILSTGGTIASRYSAEHASVVSTVAGDELVSLLGPLAPADIVVKTEQFCNVGSFWFDLALAFRLAQRIRPRLGDPEVAGVVVTHGTDTMEESAYAGRPHGGSGSRSCSPERSGARTRAG